MKIDAGGTAIYVSPRHGRKGLTIIQGTSRIMVSPLELPLLLNALEKMGQEEVA